LMGNCPFLHLPSLPFFLSFIFLPSRPPAQNAAQKIGLKG
jgi:hypothetical protein